MTQRWSQLPAGVTRGRVELAASDGRWAETFRELRDALRAALGADAVAIEHIGSTAVPGLPAKPIVDVAVALREGVDASRIAAAVEPLGLELAHDAGETGRILLVLDSAPSHRVAHIHLLRATDPHWADLLRFRDVLRRDESVRNAHAELKRELAARHAGDREAYTAAKEDWIRTILEGNKGAT